MPASDDQHSKPPQPKNNVLRIRAFELPDALSTTGCRGLTKLGSEEIKTSDSDQSATDNKRRDSIKERISKFTRFGPIYGEDTEDHTKMAKNEAWERVVEEEGGGFLEEEGGDIIRNRNKIKGSYTRLIKNIDKVLDCYVIPPCHEFFNFNSSEEKLKREQFKIMMVRDGCFFLQLALHILGGGDLLGYPDHNPYFGKSIDSTAWIPCMFFVGNQIPYTVLKALMERPFFNGVIKKGDENGKWHRPVNDPVKLALYQTVVEPHLETKKTKKEEFNKLLMRMIGKKQQPITNFATEPSSHVLQTLHNLLSGTGSGNDPTYTEMKEFHDLEANNDGKDAKILSAGELYKKGIKLVKGKPGISNIRFRDWGYRAFLEVPPFTINDQTLQLLTSLANYELDLNESEREITSYLRFMRDLARTYKDFKILEKRRIILVEGKEPKGAMVRKLDAIVSHHNSNFTLNFFQIRRKINDYGGPPWRFITFCLGIFTVVQTIFTVLSYCIPPRTKP